MRGFLFQLILNMMSHSITIFRLKAMITKNGQLIVFCSITNKITCLFNSPYLIYFISAIGDYNGHVGLGVKCSKEVATAIRGAIILAKLSIVPVRRGFWGNKIGKPHTVPSKVIIYWPLANYIHYNSVVLPFYLKARQQH